MKRQDDLQLTNIPVKANRLLYLLLVLLFLIIFRVWHLSVIQHETKLEEAMKGRKKVVVEASRRGTVRDRFNVVLAENGIDYRASFIYSDMRQVPGSITENGARRPLRKEYITELACRVGKILAMDPVRLEDLIYSHAVLYDTLPYVFKKNLTEEQYYKLKILEKEFPGLQVDQVPARRYPKGKIASHIVGYLGAMPQSRYENIALRIRELLSLEQSEEFDREEVEKELLELRERAYTMNDHVGISGVEASFENELRGYAGKQVFFSDAKGNFIREIAPTRPQIPGKRVLLTISSELQEFCEKLLGQYELDRERIFKKHDFKNESALHSEPWIRGGAIVALDPNSGEVLALASFPRFDPNDFAKGASEKVSRWVENETYQALVWDGKMALSREIMTDAVTGEWKEEALPLTWCQFLAFVLPPGSNLFGPLSEKTKIRDLIVLQRAFSELMKMAPGMSAEELLTFIKKENVPEMEPYLNLLNRWFKPIVDVPEQLLLLDLSRLVLSHEDFSPELVAAAGDMTIGEFRALSNRFSEAEEALRREEKLRFHNEEFQEWRKDNEKNFLKEKRALEKASKKQTRPFLDYIDRQERILFESHFRKVRLEKLKAAHFPEYDYELLSALKTFRDLKGRLYGRYSAVAGKELKNLAAVFCRALGTNYLRSFAFRESTIQGSVFKLVTAYAGLKQLYKERNGLLAKNDLRLFELHDHTFKSDGKLYVGNFLDGKAIPQLYKGGRVPKSLHHDLGRMDLLKAIETSSNPYFSILAGDFLKDPNLLSQAALDFGYGEKAGLKLPYEIRGNVPKDLATNKTGLYATAIGQHTLITTPLQTSLMLACIANGGKLLKPEIAHLIAGKSLLSPLLAAQSVTASSAEFRRTLFMPSEIRKTLLEGMQRSAMRALNDQGALPRLYAIHPEMKKAFQQVSSQFVGKTSTAEVIERVGLSSPSMYRHIWFGGLSFAGDSAHFGQPELVVVVYLRFGGYGKEAAPIAAQVVQKWREIKK